MGRIARTLRWQGPGGAREVLRLAWPLILGNSFWTLQITLDRVLLSRADSELVGAAMAAALLFWTPITLLQYTANYATTFVAQYTGAGMHKRVGPVVWQALYVSLAAGLGFLALLPVADEIVALGGHTAELQAHEATYFRCLCFAALPTLVTSAASSFFAGRGDSRTVLYLNGVGLAVNAPLAYAWINGYAGFPAAGIAGAGWATVVATSVTAVLSVALMLRPRFRKEFAAADWRFDGMLCLRLLRFGLPNGVVVSLDTGVFTAFLFLVGRIGAVELDATSITFTLNLISFLPIMGVGQAVGILVGQYLGDDRPRNAERSAWNGYVIALIAMGAATMVYLLFPDALAWIFRTSAKVERWEQVRVLIPVLLRYVVVYSLFDCTNLVFSFALRGAGDTVFVTLASFVLSCLIMVVPTWFAWRLGWGLFWPWGFATAYIIALATAILLRFLQGRWRLMRVIEPAHILATD